MTDINQLWQQSRIKVTCFILDNIFNAICKCGNVSGLRLASAFFYPLRLDYYNSLIRQFAEYGVNAIVTVAVPDSLCSFDLRTAALHEDAESCEASRKDLRTTIGIACLYVRKIKVSFEHLQKLGLGLSDP